MSSIMLTPTSKTTTLFKGYSISSSTLINLTPRVNHNRLIINKSSKLRKVAVITEFSAAADPAPDGFTWQIAVGALAGVTPFVVAGIEFSKRIIAQTSCEVCGGSGLVLKKENYVRCPGCGGFLPWQSWRRFFSG
ncbi:uncharacterized protein LOC133782297 isoform X1 [Humulus lupulus]|uniref:uncharacterized protein LOC133782297 isoform X1 n=1 Tax=Humulus lupulus TaxID=3486 RepID=UPI002B417490|nr:uncharacterized protein LOC133782297 isoform X1 [Humulus lupulus]